MAKEKKQTVNIDGTDYVVDELTDTQRYMLNQVVSLRDRIAKARMELDQIQVASSGFAKMLSDSKIVFESPCCETREECDVYRKEFDSYA